MESTTLTRVDSGKTQSTLSRSLSLRGTSNSQVAQEVVRIEQRLSQVQEKANNISSWISEPSQPLVDPNLPLTPPSHTQDETRNEMKAQDKDSDGDGDADCEDASRTTTTSNEAQHDHTPVIQRSPPTPDQTPPRYGEYPRTSLKIRPSPPPSVRQLSSAAQSFTTAREQLYSQENLVLSSASSGERQGTPRAASVGLGLGLETSEGSGTPTIHTSTVVPTVQSLESAWDENLTVVPDDPFVALESIAVRRVQKSKKFRQQQPKLAGVQRDDASTPEDFQASLDRDMLVKGCTRDELTPPPHSIEESRFEQNHPIAEHDNTSTIHVDKKRLSELSNQSQVVQAVVVSTPSRRRQKLRHSSKNESLRTAGSPLNTSNRSSLLSDEAKPRLHHHKGRIIDRGNRASINSDSGISMGSDLRRKAEESFPKAEIPQRRSSLRPSRRRLHEFRNVAVSDPRRDGKRPETAPEGSTRLVADQLLPKKRAMSDAVPIEALSDIRGRRIPLAGPMIPPRSSSLSAPTSRNASRTTSLTSTSLHKHNIQQQGLQQEQERPQHYPQLPVVEVEVPSDEVLIKGFLQVENAEKLVSDDALGGRHRSLLATPFSMASMQSSTPGPYEVNEATAINIYPHNNTSVLVVQQLPRHGLEQPRMSASLSGNVRINLDSFSTPTKAPTSQRRIMESPLKNPREAPRPPPVVLMPPTLAQLETVPPSRGRRSTTSSNNPGTGAFSMVRRALSARRYSETFINPLMKSLPSRSNSVKRTNRAKITPDGKRNELSGFYRPRGFWNDLSDDEDDQPRAGFIRTSIRGPADLGNSAFVRRLGSLRTRRKSALAKEGDDTYHGYGHHHSHPAHTTYDDDTADHYGELERKVGLITRIRMTPRPRPFATLGEAIREMRHKRVEEQLERQRERLRRNIGPVILQQDARPFY